MRVLVTGSSGWLGRTLVPQLRRRGHTPVGLDLVEGPETSIIGSVTQRELVDSVFKEHEIEAVIHAAALHKPDIARYPKPAFVNVNVTGTLNLIQAAVRAGNDRFILTSTTSVMVDEKIYRGENDRAIWLDETSPTTAPRNIYGVTKLAAEGVCRMAAAEHGISAMVLRVSRFFPEDDDTDRAISGENLKANELLNRRLSVHDAARAHVVALERATEYSLETLVISAPTPFSSHRDAVNLRRDAPSVIHRLFPDAAALYETRGWQFPQEITRVYDSRRAEHVLGFRCETDYASVLNALRSGSPLPITHDPGYSSPLASLSGEKPKQISGILTPAPVVLRPARDLN